MMAPSLAAIAGCVLLGVLLAVALLLGWAVWQLACSLRWELWP